MIAADVVEVHVDAVGRALPQGGDEPGGALVVAIAERGVDPGGVVEPRDLVRRARARDHPAALDLRDLAGRRADGARRAGDEDGVTRLRLPAAKQPDIGGHPRHAEHAEIGLHGGQARVDDLQPPAIRHEPLAPAERVHHVVARAQRGMPRLDDLAHGAALERAPEREALHVGVLPAHPPAHVGIDGHPEILDEHLAVRGRRQLHGRHLEVRVRGHAGGIALEADLAAGHRAPLGTAPKEVSSREARGYCL